MMNSLKIKNVFCILAFGTNLFSLELLAAGRAFQQNIQLSNQSAHQVISQLENYANRTELPPASTTLNGLNHLLQQNHVYPQAPCNMSQYEVAGGECPHQVPPLQH